MLSIYRTFAVLSLLLSAVCQAAEVRVTGPSEPVAPGLPVFLNCEGVVKGDPYSLFMVPANDGQFLVLFDDTSRPVGIYSNQKPGVYSAVLVAYDAESKSIVRSVHAVTIGKPVPPEPIPPEPEPTPPIPPQPAGFRVLILEETAERGKLPAAQVSALNSTKAREYMNAKTPKGPDGKTPEWRMWDDDHVDLTHAAENWRKAYELAKKDSAGKLPWIVVSNGNAGESRPFPQTEAELLELLRKYGN